MLYYNVAQLLKQGVGASRQHVISGDLPDIDENNPGPVHVEGQVTLTRIPSGVLAMGSARMELVRSCRRCLEPTESEIDVEFEEEFVPSLDIETGASLPITDDTETELVIDDHHILDLSEILRQHAVVAATSPGLCRDECRGLCPICGANLNNETHSCEISTVDPRLAVLATLLPSDEDEGEDQDAQ